MRNEIRKREQLYTELIAECSRLAVHALAHTLERPENVMPAYALLNRIRLTSSAAVVDAADRAVRRITEQYFQLWLRRIRTNLQRRSKSTESRGLGAQVARTSSRLEVPMFATLLRTALRTFVVMLLVASGVAHADKYVLISHAPDSDSWWNTIKNAIKQAGEDYGVQVDYRNPPSGDLADMARLIEQAAAAGYDGVVTTIADYNVLQGAIGKVTAKKIPLITINSGTPEQSEKLGALMHVGQPEYAAGKGAGEKAKAAGVKSFLCVNHYATNPASFERCRGFGEAIGADYKKATLDSGDDPTTIESKVAAYLRQNPSTNGVLTLGPTSASPTIRALEKSGQAGKLWMATFDLSDDISKAIKSGTVKFAIDQQPYLQGYIPIAVLATMKQMKTSDLKKVTEAVKANPKTQKRFAEYGLEPVYGARHISSGPGFVTKDNIAKVEKYAGQYR